jgi:hypothetical protein
MRLEFSDLDAVDHWFRMVSAQKGKYAVAGYGAVTPAEYGNRREVPCTGPSFAPIQPLLGDRKARDG